MSCNCSQPLIVNYCKKFRSDLSSLSLGLASLALFKYSWPNASLSGLDITMLMASGALCSMSTPLLSRTLTRKHLSKDTGLLGEKVAHLCLFLSSQGLAACSLLALGRTSLGDHRALAQLATIMTPMLSYYVLDTSLDPRQILLLPLSFVGVILLCHPTAIFESGTLEEYMEELYGVFLALAAAAFHSLAVVSLRAVHNTPFVVSVASSSTAGVIVWTVVTLATGASFGSCHRGAVLLSCAWLLAGSVLVRKGPWSETSVLQVVLGFIEIGLAYVVQVFGLRHVPHWSSALGALVIGLCSVATVLCEKRGASGRATSIGSQFSVSTRKISTGTQDARIEALMSMHLQLRPSEKQKCSPA